MSLLAENSVDHLKVEMLPSEKKLTACGENKVSVKGEVLLDVGFQDKLIKHKFYVTDLNCNNLCGRDLMQKLDIKLTGLDINLRINAMRYAD